MPLWGIVVYYSPCEQHLLCLLDWGGEKGGSAWITSNLWGRRSQTLWLVNLVLSRQIGFFECKRLFIDIPMVITKPTVASAQLLDPGWKLYPSNMLFMRNEYLYSNHADYFSSTPKSSKQNKVSAGGWLLFPLRSTVFIWLWAELFLHKLKLKLSEIWAQEGYANCTHSKFWDLGL